MERKDEQSETVPSIKYYIPRGAGVHHHPHYKNIFEQCVSNKQHLKLEENHT